MAFSSRRYINELFSRLAGGTFAVESVFFSNKTRILKSFNYNFFFMVRDPIYQRPKHLLRVFQLTIPQFAGITFPNPSNQPKQFERCSKEISYVLKYIERLFKYFTCSPSSFIIGLILLDRLRLSTPEFRFTAKNITKYFACSLVIAIKTFEDSYDAHESYAYVARMTCQQLGKLQFMFISQLNFELFVDKEVFNTYVYQLEKFYQMNHQIINYSHILPITPKKTRRRSRLKRRILRKTEPLKLQNEK